MEWHKITKLPPIPLSQSLSFVPMKFVTPLNESTCKQLETIRRRLREDGLSFRRIRKGLAKEPDPEQYKRAAKRLAGLEKQQEQGKVEVAYVDASGFSLKASQPMAWQHPERPIWIRA